MFSSRTAWLALAGLAASVVPLSAGTAPTASAATSPILSVVVDGRGFGHGVGVSQWGAYGWATMYGKSWQEILAIYYGNTTLSTVKDSDFTGTPVGRMTVQLTDLDGRQTAVVSDTGVLTTAADPGPTDPEATPGPRSWGSLVAREIPGQNNVYQVWGKASASCPASSTVLDEAGGWTLVNASASGPVAFTTPNGDNPAAPISDLVGLCEPDGGVRYYRGSIVAANQSTGGDRTINNVLLEDYVRGVVPRESSASWGDAAGGAGINALRTQAVAARSYALAKSATSIVAKTCDTTSCQVYSGAGYRTGVGNSLRKLEDSRSDRAVADTAGAVIRTSAGKVALAMFSASNGGRSVSGGMFPAVDDAGDAVPANPNHTWSLTLTASQIMSAWPSIGSLLGIEVTQRSGGGAWGGWADKIKLTGSSKTLTITGDDFRRAFGLKSRYVNFTALRAASGEPVGPALFLGDSVGVGVKTAVTKLFSGVYPLSFNAKSLRCTTPRRGTCATNNGVTAFAGSPVPAFVIMALGYNDTPATFGTNIDTAMQAITAAGVTRVVWVNFSERRLDKSGKSVYAPANAALAAATARWPQLIVLDWNAASIGDDATSWFLKGTSRKPDLVHLTSVGKSRFALFLRSQLDELRAQGLLPAAAPTPSTTTTSTTATTIAGGSTTTTSSTTTTTTASSTTTTTVTRPTLRQGDSGVYVTELQTLLIAKGYALVADGQFGPKTATAVKAFQTSKGLLADGVVGKVTWKALLA